jgi:V8-like Glu-specific endopeptidase
MELNSVLKPTTTDPDATVKPRVLTETAETGVSEGAKPSKMAARRLVVGRTDRPIQPSGGITLESVIGLDERTRILDTEDAPWRMICALAIEGPWGNFVGTGWFVGPQTVVTAGHCVYERSQMGGWAEKITLTPGADGPEEPFAKIVSTRFESTDKWLANQDPDFDIGVIHLDEPIGEDHGWFGVLSLPDEELKDYQVNVSGYPGDKGGREQWWARNRVRGLSPRRIFYDVDTMGGQSGAPVFIVEEEGASPKVVGIHAYGVGANKPSTVKQEVNSAPRMIPEVVDLIQGWIDKKGGGS